MSSRGVTIALLALALLFVGMLFSPPAYADSQVRIVRLSYTDGTVQIDRATGAGFEKAIMNMPITQGVRLWTQGGSHAEVEFEEGSTLRLAPGTMVYFRELGLRDAGARNTTVDVDEGTVYCNFKRKGDDEFRLAFARQEMALAKSVRFRLEVDKQEARLAVFKGELDLPGPAEVAKVKKNETLTLDLGDPGRYALAKGISTLRDDDWDAERNEYLDRYAANRSYGNVPYSYGRSDLNYYGGWDYFPGYGYLWRPYGVGYSWDPFYSGAWSWYPGWGWTWVSTYPWGWTPYRYGSWVFIGGHGWCWRPGGWNSWTRVPPVYNPPPAYRGPQPPATAFTGGGSGTPPPTVIVGGGSGDVTPRGRGRRVDENLPRRGRPPRGEMSPATGTAAGSVASPSQPTTSAPSAGTPTASTPGPAAPPATPRASSPDRGVDRDLPMRGRGREEAPQPRFRPAPAGEPRTAPPASRASEPRMSAPAPAPAPRMSAPPPSSPPPRMSAPPPSPPARSAPAREAPAHRATPN